MAILGIFNQVSQSPSLCAGRTDSLESLRDAIIYAAYRCAISLYDAVLDVARVIKHGFYIDT